jgi:hypothetical protein
MHVATSHLLYISSTNGDDARIQIIVAQITGSSMGINIHTHIQNELYICVVIFAPSDVLRPGLVQCYPNLLQVLR